MAGKYCMRYLPEHYTTFIHNPKTAGTSISQWLDANFKTVEGKKHGHIVEVNTYFPNTTYTFGVVRNPWERLASWYLFANHGNQNFKDWLLKRVTKNASNLSFQPFLLWARAWYSLDTPQHDWFGTYTKILRFENLQEDFTQIQDKLDCHIPLPTTNKNVEYNYKDLYTQELIDFVRDIYFRDILEYGYKYGN